MACLFAILQNSSKFHLRASANWPTPRAIWGRAGTAAADAASNPGVDDEQRSALRAEGFSPDDAYDPTEFAEDDDEL
jgi:hypothetical protein